MSEEVASRIRRAIEDHGPITFAEFMELALYGPGGFYEQPPVGRGGHFVTSPHVHPVFGELVAGALRGFWFAQDRPDPFRVVEVGAGDGTLADQVVEALADVPLEYVAVERSSGARARLAQRGIDAVERIEEVSAIDGGCVVANELLDNLPFHRVRRTEAGLVQIRVGIVGDALEEVETPCGEQLARIAPDLSAGEEAAVSLEALQLVDLLGVTLRSGYALLVDYGEASGRSAGPVHGYRAHRLLGDVLTDPGSADVTAGVDFSRLIARAREAGLAPFGPMTQQAGLMALGFERWSEEQRRRQGAMLSSGSGLDAVRAWGGRSRATLLVDPSGLGRLQWLVLATEGLPIPEWAQTALGG